MNIAFTKKMEKWIRDQVKAGHYNNASEVVRDIVRDHIKKAAEDAHLKKLVEEGLADLKAGRYTEVAIDDKVARKKFFDGLFEKARVESQAAHAKKASSREGAACWSARTFSPGDRSKTFTSCLCISAGLI
jgi:antitoxin ParD1/3/4